MASKHRLSLEVPDTTNSEIFRVLDTSTYDAILKVDCGTLQITPPGFTVPVAIEVIPQFNLVLNACSLGLQATNCGTTAVPLPDGIYIVRYSVSPHDKVYVEYNHLRVTQTLTVYYQYMCELEMAACEPDADVKEQLDELRLIRSFIDAAKAKVEYCHDPEAGMELLTYAKKKLDKYKKFYCSC